MPSRSALCLSVAAATVLLAGCGGSDRLSREDLVEEADQICFEQSERFRQIQVEPPGSADDAVEQTTKLISVSEDSLERFEDLDPPDELAERLDAYLEARRRALALLRRGREAAERQDRRAYSAALDRALREAGPRQRLAARLGFEDCAGADRMPREGKPG